jgi:cyclophilin family peptidyl-prolyl cis-trans isomerase
MEKDNDVRMTYIVVTVLIVILGGIAYFLQNNMSFPQVQVEGTSTTTEAIKKTVTGTFAKLGQTTQATTTMTSSTTIQVPEKITSATITTNKGVIEVTFVDDAPETVKNFATLALSNFYNGTRFHRVIRDFMIQGGDPLSRDTANKDRWGHGGPGYTFKDEISADDTFPQGTLAMANSGKNTNGSQFFIVTSIAGTPWLIGKHTVFGHVTKGLDVALRINDLQTNGAEQPLQDVIIEKIEINK